MIQKTLNQDEKINFMEEALKLANEAYQRNEVPVGALIVKDKKILSHSSNFRESSQNPLAHAEIYVIKKASEALGSWRLEDCHLFVTLEPCIMCSGVILQSRIENLYYGADSPKSGVFTMGYNFLQDEKLNHQVSVEKGILKNECSQLLTKFFTELRSTKKLTQ
jgi:tRNA(adenine34) deaminase